MILGATLPKRARRWRLHLKLGLGSVVWGVAMVDPNGLLKIDGIGDSNEAICSSNIEDLKGHQLILKFPFWMKVFLRPKTTLYYMGAIVHDDGTLHVIDATVCGATLIPHPRGQSKIAEGCAGLGGWRFGAKFVGSCISLAIELDNETARAYSMTHGVPCFSLDDALLKLSEDKTLPECVVCGDITDPKTWMLAGFLNIGTWLISAPCQPWCSSGRQGGLNSQDGRLLISVLEMAGRAGVRFILMENVPHITKHRNYSDIKDAARSAGIPLIMSHLDDCSPITPCQRRRWMAVFAHQSIDVPFESLRFVSSMQWPSVVDGHTKVTYHLREADAIHVHMTDQERDELKPTQQMVDMMKDPRFAPPFLRGDLKMRTELWQYRVLSPNGVFKAIMSAYGSQHEIDEDLLAKSGLHAFVVAFDPADPEHIRLASPWEFIASMGFPPQVVLPAMVKTAWKMTGNALSPAQATMCILRCHRLFGPRTPFFPNVGCLAKLAMKIRDASMKLSRWKVVEHAGWRMLKTNFIAPVFGPDAPEKETEPIETKVLDISPTLAYQAVEGHPEVAHDNATNLIGEAREIMVKGTVPVDIEHWFRELHSAPGAVMHRQCKHVAWLVCNLSGTFVQAGWIEARRPLYVILVKIWPHLSPQMIDVIRVNDKVETWDALIPSEEQVLVLVGLKTMVCKIHHIILKQEIHIRVDCSWRVADLRAYVACHFGLLPTQTTIQQHGFDMDDDEFIWDETDGEFTATTTQTFDGRIQVIPKKTPLAVPPDHSDVCVSVGLGFQRYSVRHPVWGTVRTASSLGDFQISQLLRMLFPDIPTQDMVIQGDLEDMPSSMQVHHLTPDKIWMITFVNGKEFPSQRLHITLPFRPLSMEEVLSNVKRWIRTPFNHRPIKQSLPGCWELTQLVATQFLSTNCIQTVICLGNGKHLDPRLKLNQISKDITLTLRACPLPGGCKESLTCQDDEAENFICNVDAASCGVDTSIAVCHSKFPTFRVGTVPFDATAAQIDEALSIGNTVAQVIHDKKTDIPLIPSLLSNGLDRISLKHECGTSEMFLPLGGKVSKKCSIFIQAPFRDGIEKVLYPEHASLAHIALDFTLGIMTMIPLTAAINGKLVDPRTIVAQIPADATVRFRVGHLPGGAKGGIRSKLRNALVLHGVPDSNVDERIESILSNINSSKMKEIESTDDEKFWEQLKQLASAAHVRLVTSVELRNFQKMKRANKSAQSNAGNVAPSQRGTKREHNKTAPLENLVFNASHFVALDESVEIIPNDRFGPDANGLTIMNSGQAMKYTHDGTISVEPLAILVVGEGCEKFGEKLMVPAHTIGKHPVIVPASLLQLGVGDIEFRANLPSAATATIDAITMEFTLRRKCIESWASTATPMHYLGLKCPELRGEGKILASWSIKCFKDRRVCMHSEAQHWHGYLKLDLHLACTVLRRSGQHGIFFTPRGVDKKPHHKFSVIPLPGRSLEQVTKLMGDAPHALGVAVLGNDFATFGVRCKREHFDAMRAHFFPESIKVDMDDIRDDDALYTIKHLVAQYTRDSMNDALKKVGWDARAIKPNGSGSWLIASCKEPPAQHLCMNGSLAIVVGRKTTHPPIVMTRMDSAMQITSGNDGSLTVSRQTRVDEIKADVSEVVDQKFAEANEQIVQLQAALQDTQLRLSQMEAGTHQELQQLKADGEATRCKLGEVEQTIHASSGTLMGQMKDLLDNFHRENGRQAQCFQNDLKSQLGTIQQDLTGRIDAIEREQGKRHKATS